MFFRYAALASLMACDGVVGAFHSSDSSNSLRGLTSSEQATTLGAINVRSAGQKRGVPDFKANFEYSHHYADHGSILRGAQSRFAITSVKYRLPTVPLEDIDLNVENITCSKSTITIDFPSARLLAEAEREWKDLSEFLVISSHAGCNDEGARAPYLVSSVDYVSTVNAAVLSVRRLEWSDAYDTMEVKFGMGQYDSSSLRRHGELRKRTSFNVSAALSAPVSYPSNSLATAIPDTSAHDIGYSLPADFGLGTYSISSGPVKESLTVKCANCSIEGSIEITHGAFSIKSNPSTTESDPPTTENPINFLEHGYFDAVFNGLGAHIKIDTAAVGSFSQSFEQSLITLALPGFQIPGIAAVGPMWVPSIRGSITVARTVDFTYGFNVTVPDESYIRLNIGDLNDSTSDGFTNTSVTTLPLTSTDPSIALTLSLSLHSELLLGINLLSGKGSIAAGAFLDIPALSVTISQLSSVDKHCNHPSNSSISTPQAHDPIIFPSRTNVVPQVDIALGVKAGVKLSIPGIPFQESFDAAATLAGAHFVLPTGCLDFHKGRKQFVRPTVAPTGSCTSSFPAGPTNTKDDDFENVSEWSRVI